MAESREEGEEEEGGISLFSRRAMLAGSQICMTLFIRALPINSLSSGFMMMRLFILLVISAGVGDLPVGFITKLIKPTIAKRTDTDLASPLIGRVNRRRSASLSQFWMIAWMSNLRFFWTMSHTTCCSPLFCQHIFSAVQHHIINDVHHEQHWVHHQSNHPLKSLPALSAQSEPRINPQNLENLSAEKHSSAHEHNPTNCSISLPTTLWPLPHPCIPQVVKQEHVPSCV